MDNTEIMLVVVGVVMVAFVSTMIFLSYWTNREELCPHGKPYRRHKKPEPKSVDFEF